MFARKDRKRSDLITRMKENIEELHQLSNVQETVMKIPRPKNKGDRHLFLEEIRGYHDNLYRAIKDSWRCECHKNLSAMLRLENFKTHELKEVQFSLYLTCEYASTDSQELWTFQRPRFPFSKRIFPLFL